MLEVKHVSKSFAKDGQPQLVLSDLNLAVGAREFVCLLGPSGCGKSTLLRIMAGLDIASLMSWVTNTTLSLFLL